MDSRVQEVHRKDGTSEKENLLKDFILPETADERTAVPFAKNKRIVFGPKILEPDAIIQRAFRCVQTESSLIFFCPFRLARA